MDGGALAVIAAPASIGVAGTSGLALVLALAAYAGVGRTPAGPEAQDARGARDASPRVALFELVGPLDGANFACGEARTAFGDALRAGETRLVEVPFARDASGTPSVAPADAGTFRGWKERDGAVWSRLPAGLTLRPLPLGEDDPPRPTPTGLALVAAAGVLVAVVRRRPGAALAAGLAAGTALLVLPSVAGGAAAPVRVLEGDAASGTWIAVESAAHELAFPAGELERLTVVPPGGAIAWRVAGPARAEGGGARATWIARAPGRRLARSWIPGRAGTLSARANGLGTLDATWIRPASGGGFAWLGRWELGKPLPETPGAAGSSGAGAPPGWLATALPPGTPVLLGRLARGGAWVRVVGFSTQGD